MGADNVGDTMAGSSRLHSWGIAGSIVRVLVSRSCRSRLEATHSGDCSGGWAWDSHRIEIVEWAVFLSCICTRGGLIRERSPSVSLTSSLLPYAKKAVQSLKGCLDVAPDQLAPRLLGDAEYRSGSQYALGSGRNRF